MLHINASIECDYDLPDHSRTDSDSNESFDDLSEFLSCLRVMLWTYFEECSPQLTFCVDGLYQEMNTLLPIAYTLELPFVQACKNVCFVLPKINGYAIHSYKLTRGLPYQNHEKVISDWLHRPYVSGSTPRVEDIRSLTIGSTEHRFMIISHIKIIDLTEDLKEVSLIEILMSFKFSLAQIKLSNACGKVGTGTVGVVTWQFFLLHSNSTFSLMAPQHSGATLSINA